MVYSMKKTVRYIMVLSHRINEPTLPERLRSTAIRFRRSARFSHYPIPPLSNASPAPSPHRISAVDPHSSTTPLDRPCTLDSRTIWHSPPPRHASAIPPRPTLPAIWDIGNCCKRAMPRCRTNPGSIPVRRDRCRVWIIRRGDDGGDVVFLGRMPRRARLLGSRDRTSIV